MTGRLFLMMGTPGSGKSTFLARHIGNDFNKVIVSRDAIRFSMVKEGEPYFSKENEVFKEFIEQIDYFLSEDFDVYADATHLNQKSRAKVLRALSVKPREVSVIWIHIPLGECFEHNEKRAGTRSYVPPTQLRRMAHSLQVPDLDEGIDAIYIIRHNMFGYYIHTMTQRVDAEWGETYRNAKILSVPAEK